MQSSTRQKALFTWELGGGMGHVTVMSRIASQMNQDKLDLWYALSSPELGLKAGFDPERVLAAPLWPGQRGWKYQPTKPARSLGEALARSVFISAEAVHTQLQQWLQLLAQVKPHIVFADYSPGVLMATRALGIPAVAYGVGYYTLHQGATEFPCIWNQPGLVPERTETAAFQDINTALSQLGCAELESYTQAMLGTRQLAMTLALVDPSGHQRCEPLCNPVLSHDLNPTRSDGNRLFIHFQDMGHRDLLNGIIAAGPPATVYIRNLPGTARKLLTDAGFDVLNKPADLGKLLPACCGVIHYGGLGLSSLALASGVPQVMVSTDLEKYFTATRIEAAGLGCHLGMGNFSAQRLIQAIRYIREHDGIKNHAFSWAQQNRTSFDPPGVHMAARKLESFAAELCPKGAQIVP